MKLLREAIEIFLDDQIATSRRSYEYIFENLLDYLPDNIALKDVHPEYLVKYIQGIRARPTVKSEVTVNKYIKTLKVLFNFCYKMNWIEYTPTTALRTRKARVQRRHKAMTNDEFSMLVDMAREEIGKRNRPNRLVDAYRNLALILFVGDTGCRARGCATLKIMDLDLDKQCAYIVEKGDKPRTVWFGDMCAKALQDYLDKRINWLNQMNYGLLDVYVFHRQGCAMQNANVGRIIRRMCKRAGIRSLGSHSLRHRKGTQMADAKVAPSVAATALGHDDPAMTLNFYYPKDTERAESAIRELAAGANSSPKPEPSPTEAVKEKKANSKIINLSDYLAG